jgi:hypothetical protein
MTTLNTFFLFEIWSKILCAVFMRIDLKTGMRRHPLPHTHNPDVLGPVPEVGVMARRPQGLLNVGDSFRADVAVLRSCALDI